MELLISQEWRKILETQLSKESFKKLQHFLDKETVNVFPNKENIFAALNYTSLKEIKVVIIGQDPYHKKGQANGLSFSVSKGTKIPPSLQNIYKELHSDLGVEIPKHGDLSNWAKQGVLLLNSILTVQEGNAGSHKNKGWEEFTDYIISIISQENENCVFLLWGNFAQKKEILIDSKKHLILKAVHPSPLSVYRGFFGCKHFSKANEYLINNNRKSINWELKN